MRISHNIAAMISQTAIARNQQSLNTSLERLSTGTRINRASDDAAGLSVSENLRTQVRGLSQAKKNAEQGVALLQVAEGAAAEIANIMQRMRELAVQAANSTLTTTERNYTDTEFQAMMSEISRISRSAQYNGMTLLDGASGSFGVSGGANSVLHIGANNNGGSTSGSVDTIAVSITSVTLGALGLTLTSGAGSNSSTNITSTTNASSAITTIDTAINSVNDMRASLGATINRIEHAVNNMSDREVTVAAAESAIRDVDFAYETTNFTKAQIMAQVGASMLSQANISAANILHLIS